jgi:putative glutamine amidotransferase
MITRPLIAVPAYPVKAGRVQGWEKPGVAAPTPYVEALQRAGALEAILMPVAIDDVDAAAVLERFDGLLLMGGGDLHPEEYGQERRDEIYGVIPHRDRFELALARAAVDRGVPTLAICRGHQVLNVALGGSLDQHITDRDGVLPHGKPGVPGGSTVHDIEIEPGSRPRWASAAPRAHRTTIRRWSARATGCGSAPAPPTA